MLPEMKQALKRYKAVKAKKKALKKDRERDAQAAKAQDNEPGGGKKWPPSLPAVPPEWHELCCASAAKPRSTWRRRVASTGRTSKATPVVSSGTQARCA